MKPDNPSDKKKDRVQITPTNVKHIIKIPSWKLSSLLADKLLTAKDLHIEASFSYPFSDCFTVIFQLTNTTFSKAY